jgi:hypothetical protein
MSPNVSYMADLGSICLIPSVNLLPEFPINLLDNCDNLLIISMVGRALDFIKVGQPLQNRALRLGNRNTEDNRAVVINSIGTTRQKSAQSLQTSEENVGV